MSSPKPKVSKKSKSKPASSLRSGSKATYRRSVLQDVGPGRPTPAGKVDYNAYRAFLTQMPPSALLTNMFELFFGQSRPTYVCTLTGQPFWSGLSARDELCEFKEEFDKRFEKMKKSGK